MEGQCALWSGRFQPPSIAHMKTALTILQSWRRLKIFASFEIDPPPHILAHWSEYVEASRRTSYGPGKNPFTPEEVCAMWQGAIQAHELSSRISVQAMGRPEFDPEFRLRFPPNEYDFVLVEVETGDTGIDTVHDDVLPRLHNRPIYRVSPEFKLHNSEIRKRVFELGHSWQQYLPEGAYEIFECIRGPERVREAFLLARS